MTQFYLRQGTMLHERDNSTVRVGKAGQSGDLTRRENCVRCGGQGGSQAWTHTGWTCYRCGGSGKEMRHHRVFTAERLEKLNAAERVRADKRETDARVVEATRIINFNLWAAPHAKLIEAIKSVEGNSFLQDLTRKLQGHWALSDRQMDAAARVVSDTAQRAAQDDGSAYVGEVGNRVKFDATVEFTKEFDGHYGVVTLIKLRDTEGNIFAWFASCDVYELGRGDTVSVTGTVKSHDEYKGAKQTMLTRCKYEKYTIVTADQAATMEIIT